MKKLILMLSVGLLPCYASAQVSAGSVVNLVRNGHTLAKRANTKSGASKSTAPVARFRSGNKYIPQQRTEAKQLHGPAAEDIKALESYLTAAHAAFTRPEEQNVCPNPALAQTFLGNIKQLQPKWNILPYQQELAFYVQEHKRRQLPAVTPNPS